MNKIVIDSNILVSSLFSGAILITGNIRHFPAEPFIMSPADFLRTYSLSIGEAHV